MKRLQEKGQNIALKKEAARAIEVYHEWFASGFDDKCSSGDSTGVASLPWQEILDEVHREIKARDYWPKTFATYAYWISDFQGFVREKPPVACETQDVEGYLSHPAVNWHLAATTQNQAFHALPFLFPIF